MGPYFQVDIFALPTLGECSGIATVEAAATWLPVVMTDVGRAAEIIDNRQTGSLIPSNDAHELTGALSRLLADGTSRCTPGERGRCLTEQKFDAARNACRIVDRVADAAGSPPAKLSKEMAAYPVANHKREPGGLSGEFTEPANWVSAGSSGVAEL